MFGFMRTPQPFEDDFVEFWSHCPRKVGRIAAQKEYIKARRRGATREALLDGLERYKATKPSWQDWCHPRTFLAQGRWMDEVEVPKPKAAYEPWVCPHTPRCPHRTACWVVSQRKTNLPSDGNGRP